jgi:Cu(I)/Ag(I) efflux system membrane fusion protein
MNKLTLVMMVIVLAIGVAVGYQWADRGAERGAEVIQSSPERKPLFYRSPMNPQVTSPVPVADAMGMDYVPVYADDNGDDAPAGTVRIDPVTVQNIGVRTAPVERRTISRVINTVGRIDYDEKRLYRLHPKTEGWVEELRVDTTGSKIARGDILMSLYSPQLVSTQQEYLLALKNLDTLKASEFPDTARGAQDLLVTSQERLRFFDVPEHQIKELRESRVVKKQLHIHAPAGGIVTKVGARDGQYITPKDELFTIADLSRVWVFVDIYEDELPWVKIGDRADMTVMGVPGEIFSGELTYIYPYAESKTRTIKARLEVENSAFKLKPDMFANIALQASARQGVLAVPDEAIVRSGLNEKVFVVRAPGKFEPRDVVIGVSSEGYTEVRDGVEVGEVVVVSAQFLIDSESNMREATSKMRAIKQRAGEAADDH